MDDTWLTALIDELAALNFAGDRAGADRAICRAAAEITELTAELAGHADACIEITEEDYRTDELDEPAKIALRKFAELAKGEAMSNARVVLERPSQIRCDCGHIAAEHGAVCFRCYCEQSIYDVMRYGYRSALASEVERREAAEEPSEARTLDDVVACAKRALLNLNAIPDGLYPPWDETITQAHLLLDDMGIGSLEEQLAELAVLAPDGPPESKG